MEGRQWLHAREKRLLADPRSEPWPAVCRDHLDLRRGTPLSAPELFLAGSLCVRGPLSCSLSGPFSALPGPGWLAAPQLCSSSFHVWPPVLWGLGPIVRTTPRGPCDSEGATEVCSPAGEARVQHGLPAGLSACPRPVQWPTHWAVPHRPVGVIFSSAWPSHGLCHWGAPRWQPQSPDEYSAKAGRGLPLAGQPASLCLSCRVPATRRGSLENAQVGLKGRSVGEAAITSQPSS